MRKTTKFDQAPWAGGQQADSFKGVQPMGRKNVGMMSKNMRRMGGKRGA